MSESAPAPEPGPDRRRFLSRLAAGLAALLSAAAAAPLIGVLLTPLLRRVVRLEGATIDAGAVDTFSATPKKVVVATARVDAWTRSEREVAGAVYIVKNNDDDIQAFSAICPHASCAVDFDKQRGRFVCPCHQSLFAATGELQSGPGPRGLDALPVTVEDGRVHVTYERYRPGIATKERV